MDDREKTELVNLTLAPYMQKATALIGRERKVGGNQFRHAIATLAILIDYHYTDPVLLKAAVIHDLIEDIPETTDDEIIRIDSDGYAVLNLVKEVTKGNETKIEYLRRIRDNGSFKAKVLKVADRISNLTDLHNDIFNIEYIKHYLDETEEYIYPVALEINEDMAFEVNDLIKRRRRMINNCHETDMSRFVFKNTF